MNVIFFSNTNFLKKNQNSFYFIVVTKNKKIQKQTKRWVILTNKKNSQKIKIFVIPK